LDADAVATRRGELATSRAGRRGDHPVAGRSRVAAAAVAAVADGQIVRTPKSLLAGARSAAACTAAAGNTDSIDAAQRAAGCAALRQRCMVGGGRAVAVYWR